MTTRAMWSRRALIGATLATTGLPMRPLAAQEAISDDRGVGGTGVAPPGPEADDRGIGGTGVIGTIQRFGSIVVNDLRITFPRTVTVRIDDRPARLRDLAVGHVVHVLAHQNGAHLSTHRIDAVSEVSGPIDTIDPDGFVVLGQKVIVADARQARRWKASTWVSVSGLRRLDGAITASLVERRAPGVAHLVGVPQLDEAGTARVGDLPLQAIATELAGQRLRLSGHLSADGLVVSEARPLLSKLLAAQPDRLSFEDYVGSENGEVRFGSGLPSVGKPAISDVGAETRAVVLASIAPGGRIQVDGIRAEARSRGYISGSSAVQHETPGASPRQRPTEPATPSDARPTGSLETGGSAHASSPHGGGGPGRGGLGGGAGGRGPRR